jgi:hypothetical protein
MRIGIGEIIAASTLDLKDPEPLKNICNAEKWNLYCKLSVSQLAFPGSSPCPLRKLFFRVLPSLHTVQFERTTIAGGNG